MTCPPAKPIRAAQYIRMSTDHQQYSPENQANAIAEYARKHGLEIVRTYDDEGESGLTVERRDAFQELIDCVERGEADFEVILVFDISRWGRFQNPDEAGHYEYLCKQAGVRVEYCAEQFVNDGTMPSTVMKSLKRVMAAEKSRELSEKVFPAQCNLIMHGFRQGGPAGYGLRRFLIDQAGKPKFVLEPGQRKSLQTDRVLLVPGPPEERAVVRRIYRSFLHERKMEREIADELRAEGLTAESGRPWTRGMVHQVLTNEKYIGHNVYNRISFKLKKKRVRNPPEEWVRKEGAFEPIVDVADFMASRALILQRHQRFSNEELLEKLKALAARHGRLSGILIDETDGMPSSTMYRHRFGSLIRAYQLIAYSPERDMEFIEINRRLRRLYPELLHGIVRSLQKHGGRVVRDPQTDLLTINGIITVSIVVTRCWPTALGTYRWIVRLDEGLKPDLTIAVRMDPANAKPLDYYILPSMDVRAAGLRIKEDNGVFLDGYRFESLEFFFGMAETVQLEAA